MRHALDSLCVGVGVRYDCHVGVCARSDSARPPARRRPRRSLPLRRVVCWLVVSRCRATPIATRQGWRRRFRIRRARRARRLISSCMSTPVPQPRRSSRGVLELGRQAREPVGIRSITSPQAGAWNDASSAEPRSLRERPTGSRSFRPAGNSTITTPPANPPPPQLRRLKPRHDSLPTS